MKKILIYIVCVVLFFQDNRTVYAAETSDMIQAVTEDDPQYGRANGYIDDDFREIQMLTADDSEFIHNDKFNGYKINDVIDVSKYQGDIDWAAVKASGIDYAIIRAGFRGYGETASLNTDTNFEINIKGAIAAGLEVGVYFFSQAITEEEAVEEANYVLKLIEGYDVTLPVVIDFEYASSSNGLTGRLYKANLGKNAGTEICQKFCATVEKKGYTAMVYANKSMLQNGLNALEISKDYKIWLANYTTSTSYEGDYDFWQYTQSGTINGISGNVDMSFWYVEDVSKECTASSIGKNCPSIHYTDLDLNSWYHLYVDYVVSNGYMIGNGNNKFGAGDSTTRAMIVTILYSMSGETVSEDVIAQNKFQDVPKEEYYAKPVAWAKSKGIVAGVSETEFRPNENITREQMLLMLQKYAEYLDVECDQRADLAGFLDGTEVSDWALESMEWASAVGMISGVPKEEGVYLKPQDLATRAEVATFIKAFCEYKASVSVSSEECTIQKRMQNIFYM